MQYTADELRQWADWMDNSDLDRPKGINPNAVQDLLVALAGLLYECDSGLCQVNAGEVCCHVLDAEAAIAKANEEYRHDLCCVSDHANGDEPGDEPWG